MNRAQTGGVPAACATSNLRTKVKEKGFYPLFGVARIGIILTLSFLSLSCYNAPRYALPGNLAEISPSKSAQMPLNRLTFHIVKSFFPGIDSQTVFRRWQDRYTVVKDTAYLWNSNVIAMVTTLEACDVHTYVLSPQTYESIGALQPLSMVGCIPVLTLSRSELPGLEPDNFDIKAPRWLDTNPEAVSLHLIKKTIFTKGQWVFTLSGEIAASGPPEELLIHTIIPRNKTQEKNSLYSYLTGVLFFTHLSKESIELHIEEWFAHQKYTYIQPRITELAPFFR